MPFKKGQIAWNKGIKRPVFSKTDDRYKRICEICKSIYFLNPRIGIKWAIKTGRGRFCSDKCNRFHRKGIRVSPETEFIKGMTSWNRGVRGEFNGKTYDGLHDWVERNLGKPNKCEFCRTTKSKVFHWSNKSGKYETKLEDFQRLCAKCHCRYDFEKFGARKEFYI